MKNKDAICGFVSGFAVASAALFGYHFAKHIANYDPYPPVEAMNERLRKVGRDVAEKTDELIRAELARLHRCNNV